MLFAQSGYTKLPDNCTIPPERVPPVKSSTAQRRWGVEQRALAQTGTLANPQSPLSLRYRARVEIQPKEIRWQDRMCRWLNVAVALVR